MMNVHLLVEKQTLNHVFQVLNKIASTEQNC